MIVKRQGAIRPCDLTEAGTPCSASGKAGGNVSVEGSRPGKLTVEVEAYGGRSYKEIMRRIGRDLTDAALREHGGKAGEAMRALGMSKDVWYRIRGG